MVHFVSNTTMSPKHKIRRIGILAFPGVEVLDVTGPHEVFTFANVMLQREGDTQEPVYLITVLAEQPGR